MNTKELAAIKRLMVIINLNAGRRCPICHDELSATASNLMPVWSDYFDNIVCADCAASVVKCIVCLTNLDMSDYGEGGHIYDGETICSHCDNL